MDSIHDEIDILDSRIDDLNSELRNYIARMKNTSPESSLRQGYPEFFRTNREQFRLALREVDALTDILRSYRNLSRNVPFTPRKGG